MKIKVKIALMCSLFLSIDCKSDVKDFNLYSTYEILETSEAGSKLAKQKNVKFTKGIAKGIVIEVFPDKKKQKIEGIGTSFTESSAFVLAHLDKNKRSEVMNNIYSEKGADFTLTRTHIGSCDFTVKGKYSYADQKDDKELKSFSIQEDLNGFDKKEFPNIKDESYDLLPMIKEAQKIKSNQKDSILKIVASAWTAPSWMKDIEKWYIPGSPENNWQGTGGKLKPEYESVYADYLIKYLDSYKTQNIYIWGITPVNEPYGNNGQWESMSFSPESQNDFVKKHLGPKLKTNGFDNLKLLIYDQNRDGLEDWTNLIFADKETAPYVFGAAVHWYESTFKVSEDAFERVNQKFPKFSIIHTEGCIDDLGKNPPNGVTDPKGYKEENWFKNDSFFWNDNASDWAYSVTWQGVKVEDHPLYVPVHRYARNIIISLDHWVSGWIDWNIVLDKNGGPNHVGNFCGAPIMIDTEKEDVYYTPIYHILAQFSKTIRPGDFAVMTKKDFSTLPEDALHTCATINKDGMISVQLLNTQKTSIDYNLQIENCYAKLTIPANSVKTVRIKLEK